MDTNTLGRTKFEATGIDPKLIEDSFNSTNGLLNINDPNISSAPKLEAPDFSLVRGMGQRDDPNDFVMLEYPALAPAIKAARGNRYSDVAAYKKLSEIELFLRSKGASDGWLDKVFGRTPETKQRGLLRDMDKQRDFEANLLKVDRKKYDQILALAEWTGLPKGSFVHSPELFDNVMEKFKENGGKEEQTTWEWTSNAFMSAVKNQELGSIGFKYLLDPNAPDPMQDPQIQAYYAQLEKMNPNVLKGQNWLQEYISATASLAGQHAKQMGESAKWATGGMLLGAAGAAILGTGGAAALPLGVAAGSSALVGAGASLGATYGSALSALETQAGLTYLEYLQLKKADGTPVDKDEARLAAAIFGIASGAVEFMQFGTLGSAVAKAIGVKNIGTEAAKASVGQQLMSALKKGSFSQIAKKYAVDGLKTMSAEALEEVIQGVITGVGENVLTDNKPVSEILTDAFAEGKAIFKGMTIPTLVMTALGAGGEWRGIRNTKLQNALARLSALDDQVQRGNLNIDAIIGKDVFFISKAASMILYQTEEADDTDNAIETTVPTGKTMSKSDFLAAAGIDEDMFDAMGDDDEIALRKDVLDQLLQGHEQSVVDAVNQHVREGVQGETLNERLTRERDDVLKGLEDPFNADTDNARQARALRDKIFNEAMATGYIDETSARIGSALIARSQLIIANRLGVEVDDLPSARVQRGEDEVADDALEQHFRHIAMYDYESFSNEYMSSGEGGQWFGWGTYLMLGDERAEAIRKYYKRSFQNRIDNDFLTRRHEYDVVINGKSDRVTASSNIENFFLMTIDDDKSERDTAILQKLISARGAKLQTKKRNLIKQLQNNAAHFAKLADKAEKLHINTLKEALNAWKTVHQQTYLSDMNVLGELKADLRDTTEQSIIEWIKDDVVIMLEEFKGLVRRNKEAIEFLEQIEDVKEVPDPRGKPQLLDLDVEGPENDMLLHWEEVLDTQDERIVDIKDYVSDRLEQLVEDGNAKTAGAIANNIKQYDLFGNNTTATGRNLYYFLSHWADKLGLRDFDEERYAGKGDENERMASLFLNYMGYDGHIFWANGNRNGESERNVYNAVIYEPETTLEITARNGVPASDWRKAHPLMQSSEFTMGSFQFNDSTYENVISLYERADKSTFIHEAAHLIHSNLIEISMMDDAPAWISDMLDTIKDFVGWEEGQQGFTRKQYEKFADGFLRYLQTGETPLALAPTASKLRGVFRWFATQCAKLIGQARIEKIELSPEILELYDQLISLPEEFSEAEADFSSVADISFNFGENVSLDPYEGMDDDERKEALEDDLAILQAIGRALPAEDKEEYQRAYEEVARHLEQDEMVRENAWATKAGTVNAQDLQTARAYMTILYKVGLEAKNSIRKSTTDKLNKARAKLKEVEAKLAAVTKGKGDIEKIAEQAAKSKLEATEAKSELGKANAEIERLTKENKAQEREILETIGTAYDDKQALKEQLKQAKSEYEQAIKALNAEVRLLTKQKTTAEARLEKANEKNKEKIKAVRDEKNKNSKIARAEISWLNSNIKKWAKELARAEKELNKIGERLAKYGQDLQDAKFDNSVAKGELKEQTKQNKKLEKRAVTAELLYRTLQSEYDNMVAMQKTVQYCTDIKKAITDMGCHVAWRDKMFALADGIELRTLRQEQIDRRAELEEFVKTLSPDDRTEDELLRKGLKPDEIRRLNTISLGEISLSQLEKLRDGIVELRKEGRRAMKAKRLREKELADARARPMMANLGAVHGRPSVIFGNSDIKKGYTFADARADSLRILQARAIMEADEQMLEEIAMSEEEDGEKKVFTLEEIDERHKEAIASAREQFDKEGWIKQQARGLKRKFEYYTDQIFPAIFDRHRIMDYLDGGGAKFDGAFYKFFVRDANACRDNMNRALEARTGAVLENKMAELGITLDDMYKEVEIPGEDMSVYYAGLNPLRSQVLGLYVLSKDAQALAAVLHGNFNGIPFKQRALDACISVLTENEKKLGDFLFDELNNKERFKALNEVWRDVMNDNITQKERYVSMFRLERSSYFSTLDDKMLEKFMEAKNSIDRVIPGSTIDRLAISNKGQTAVETDIFKIFTRHIREEEHFIAYGRYLRDARNVLFWTTPKRRSGILRGISEKYGRDILSAVTHLYNDYATPTIFKAQAAMDGFLGVLIRNKVRASLSFNIGVWLKNLASCGKWFIYANPTDILSTVWESLTDVENFKSRVYGLDPNLLNRQGNVVTDYMKSNPASLTSRSGLNRKWNRFLDAGMAANAVLDRWVASVMFESIRKTELRKNGTSQERAVKLAQEATQRLMQPADHIELPDLWRRGGWYKVALLFSTEGAKTMNILLYDLPQMLKGNGTIAQGFKVAAGMAISSMLLRMMENGGPDDSDDRDEEETWAHWVAMAIANGSLGNFPVIGNQIMEMIEGKSYNDGHNILTEPLFQTIRGVTKLIEGFDDENDGSPGRNGMTDKETGVWSLMNAYSLLRPFPYRAAQLLYMSKNAEDIWQWLNVMRGSRRAMQELKQGIRDSY